MVLKVTKQIAKNKALKLMEEVGISEPRKRYKQYPFESPAACVSASS